MNVSSPPHTRYCLACGHSLYGIASQHCPECGHEFDPDDARTTSPAPDTMGILLATRGGWYSHAIVAGWALLCFYGASVPEGRWFPSACAVVGGLAIVGIWLAAFGNRFWFGRMKWRRTATRGKALWLVVPVTVAMVLLMLALRLPLRVTFAISENALTQFATASLLSPPSFAGYRRLGMFEVYNVERSGGSILMRVRGSGSLRDGGWAYMPGARMPDTQMRQFTHFTGPWYTFNEVP